MRSGRGSIGRLRPPVVEQRFFAGLTLEETAEVLGVSMKTVQRNWMLARAWLRKEIAADLLNGDRFPS